MVQQPELLVRLEITNFLANNPHVWETCAGLARKLGRDEASTAQALERLVGLGLLACRGSDQRRVYRYVQPSHALPEKERGEHHGTS